MISRLQSLPRWGLCALLALGLHAAVVAWSLYWRPQSEPLELPPAAMMVELAPLPAVAPAAAPAAKPEPPAPAKPVTPPPEPPKPITPPEPPAKPVAQQKPVEAPKPKLALPPPKPKAPPQPPKPIAKPVEEAAPPQVAKSQPTTSAPATPSASSTPTQAKTAPQSGSQTPSNAVPNWQGLVRAHLSRYKNYPSEARRRGDEGRVVIRFRIDAQGHLLSCEVEQSSGVRSLDRAALQMFRRADPLPPPPPELLKGGTLEVVAPFAYSLTER